MPLLHLVRRPRLGALRLVREDSFDGPWGYSEEPFRCRSPERVFRFMKPYARREETEVLWILALDAQRGVIRNRPLTVSRGIVCAAFAHPREVFRLAIHVNACSVIVVHNHPSGDPTPSEDDKAITRQLAAAGNVLDLPLTDHVIVGCRQYVSFRECGLL